MTDEDLALKELVLFRSPLASVSDGPRPELRMDRSLPDLCTFCREPHTQYAVGQDAFHTSCLAAQAKKRMRRG
jgi:hypothetical protein